MLLAEKIGTQFIYIYIGEFQCFLDRITVTLRMLMYWYRSITGKQYKKISLLMYNLLLNNVKCFNRKWIMHVKSVLYDFGCTLYSVITM